MKKLLSVLLVFVSIILFAGCEKKDDNVLVILTSSGYAPYEMIDTNGKLIGFDIELAEKVADGLGYTIEWKDVSFEGIIAALQSNQGDLAVAGLTPTPERKLSVDFSDFYYLPQNTERDYLLITKDSDITSIEDLNGKKIGAQIGTVQVEVAEDGMSTYGYTIDQRNTYNEMVQELNSGRLDGVVLEKLVAEEFIKNNSDLNMILFNVNESEEASGNAMAFPKNSALIEKFNKEIEDMKQNGELDTLINKWFK